MTKGWIIIFAIALTAGLFAAGDVKVSASVDKEKVEVGESFLYSVEVWVKGSNMKAPKVTLPSFEGFKVGQVWQETQIMLAGETVTKYVEKVELEAEKKGTFTIGPAEVEVGGKIYRTDSVKMQVVSPSRMSRRNRVGTSSLYLEWTLDKRELFLNERAIVSVELFSKYPLWSRPKIIVGRSLFHRMELLSCYRKAAHGRMDRWVLQIAFYPKRTGSLLLGPVKVVAPLGIFEEVPLTIGPFEVKVKDLPRKDRPEGFEGAVGKFRARIEADRESINLGEAVKVKVVIEGTGNLDLTGFKELTLPDGMEGQLWDVEEHVFEENGTLWKRRTYLYVLYPHRSGIFYLEGVRFPYFDTAEKEYKLCESGKLRIFVGLRGGSLAKVLELN